jgi:hypothetical protein
VQRCVQQDASASCQSMDSAKYLHTLAPRSTTALLHQSISLRLALALHPVAASSGAAPSHMADRDDLHATHLSCLLSSNYPLPVVWNGRTGNCCTTSASQHLLCPAWACHHLHSASKAPCAQRVTILTRAPPHGPGLNDKHMVTGKTALHEAVMLNSLPMVQHLLAAGADPNVGHGTQGPPLLHAAAWGETEMVELLLAKGADANATDVALYTAMHYSCTGGHVETTR